MNQPRNRMPLAVKHFLQSCFDSFNLSEIWIPPGWTSNRRRLVRHINTSYQNKQQLLEYYELGVLLDYLCDTFEKQILFLTLLTV
jgi:hypothetical protein